MRTQVGHEDQRHLYTTLVYNFQELHTIYQSADTQRHKINKTGIQTRHLQTLVAQTSNKPSCALNKGAISGNIPLSVCATGQTRPARGLQEITRLEKYTKTCPVGTIKKGGASHSTHQLGKFTQYPRNSGVGWENLDIMPP